MCLVINLSHNHIPNIERLSYNEISYKCALLPFGLKFSNEQRSGFTLKMVGIVMGSGIELTLGGVKHQEV